MVEVVEVGGEVRRVEVLAGMRLGKGLGVSELLEELLAGEVDLA